MPYGISSITEAISALRTVTAALTMPGRWLSIRIDSDIVEPACKSERQIKRPKPWVGGPGGSRLSIWREGNSG
jgi:hypothetical protein